MSEVRSYLPPKFGFSLSPNLRQNPCQLMSFGFDLNFGAVLSFGTRLTCLICWRAGK
jgi:hypothetical protein